MPLFTRLVCLLVCIVAGNFTHAQKISLHVSVKDSAQKHPLSNATVVLLGEKDSSLVDFGITDSLGHFFFKNVKITKPTVVLATSLGYSAVKLPLPANKNGGNKATIDSLEILLPPDYHLLETVAVTARMSPIKMNGDTLEFNANYFKTRPNAMVEELLRKLPGVEVRQNGEVYVNGQRVSKILVDGKEFFSSDPLVLLRNLPAEIIEKIQVANEKNTVAKETRQQKDIPKTINLKLKKEIKGGIFGKFFGGYGTDGRYEAGGIVNMFKDTLQMSLIGSSNNQGREGFSMDDLYNMGGFGRSRGVGQSNAYDVMSYGSYGIQKQHLGGANINYDFGKKLQINGQYFYKQIGRQSAGDSHSEQFIADSSLLSDGTHSGFNKDNTHMASVGVRWKQDSTGFLTASVRANFASSESNSVSAGKTYSQKVPLLTESQSSYGGNGHTNDIGINADYQKTFPKRKIDIQSRVSFSKNSNRSVASSAVYYLQALNGFRPDSTIQTQDRILPKQEAAAAITVRKNWKDNHSAEFTSEYTNTHEDQTGGTFRYSPLSGEKEFVPSMSVNLYQKRNLFNNSASYRYNYKSFSVSAGVSFKNLLMENDYDVDSLPDLKRSFGLVSPVISINIKGVSLSFNQNLREPFAHALRPITDNTNPLYISTGNPNLKPATVSTVGLQYFNYFSKSQISFNINGRLGKTKNSVAGQRVVFADGKSVSSFVNVDRSYNHQVNMGLGKSYHKNNWDYYIGLSGAFNYNQEPLLLNGNSFANNSQYIYASVNGSISWKNILRWNPGYNFNTNSTKSQDTLSPSNRTKQHTVTNLVHWQILKRLSVDANINYNLNPGAAPGYKKQWLFCDMALAWAMFKKEQMQIRLSGFDLLNQNEGIYRYTYGNYITDERTLVQKRYFMLTLIYSLKKI